MSKDNGSECKPVCECYNCKLEACLHEAEVSFMQMMREQANKFPPRWPEQV